MKKLSIIALFAFLAVSTANAQFIKKLEKALTQTNNCVNSTAGQTKNKTSKAQPKISGKGFNGIKIGMSLGSVPRSMAGVYNRIMESGMGDDGTQYEGYDGDNRIVSFEDGNDDNRIDGIFVAKQGVQIENTPIYIGMPLNQFKIIKGVKRIPNSYNYSYGYYEISFDENNRVDGVYIK